jgi:hypothetical protein
MAKVSQVLKLAAGSVPRILVAFDVQVALKVTHRKQEADLRTDAGDPRADAAERGGCAEIVGDLLKIIAGNFELNLFRYEMRYAQTEMEVDARYACRTRSWPGRRSLRSNGITSHPASRRRMAFSSASMAACATSA